MIKKERLMQLRQALLESARPLIFFDDDPDGLCSFLQFYKLNPEARGIIFKAAGDLDEKFIRKVEDFQPDKIFILDIHNVTQEFIDQSRREVHWLDHHSLVERKHIQYYNPMVDDADNRPTSYWAYLVAGQSLWKAMVGCIGDWFIPADLVEGFREKYPGLLPEDVKSAPQALFDAPIGMLARAFSYVLKGQTKSAMSCVKILTRIDDPHEILEQTSSKGRYIWKKFQKIDAEYQSIKNSIEPGRGKLLLHIYPSSKMSLTSDLSNEIVYRYPMKFIIIGRKNNNEYKLSLRSQKYEVLPVLTRALEGVQGYGGGHLHACGANVKEDDFDRFISNIKKLI